MDRMAEPRSVKGGPSDGPFGDEAKGPATTAATDLSTAFSDDEVPEYMRTAAQRGFLGTLRHYESFLDKKLGVEAHGYMRKRPEDRDPAYAKWQSQVLMVMLWMSSNLNLSCFTTGFLGWELGLNLGRTIAIIVLATLLGSMVTAWCATLGPPTGLRQVSISRYSMGWWPAKLVAALNVVEQMGWSSVACITGGLALSAVSDGSLGSAVGVIIAALLGFVVSFVGLRAVFAYNKYAGLVLAVVFIIMYGEVGSFGDMATPTQLSGATLTGTSLTLFAVVYGSTASWSSIVADYYVEYPADTSKVKVFTLTTLGNFVPTCFGMIFGAVCGSALNKQADWSAAYDNGIGFLIRAMIHPAGLAKFLLVVMAFSGIANYAMCLYSAGLSVQQFARPLGVVPRFFWTCVMLVASILLSLVGRDKLLTFLQNFLSLLGYWNTSFFVIVCTEHYLFRGGWHGVQGYDLEAWNTSSRMPVGFAGGLAFAAGIVGCIVGMSETWYVGKLADMIGDPAYGGDIGNELAFVFTLVVFIPARWLEYRIIKR